MLFAGIDGGQSSTVAVVLDEHGAVRGRAAAGPSDHVDEGAASARAAAACEAALAGALAAADLPPDAPLAAVVVGMSGFEDRWYGVEPRFTAPVVRYVHDAPIALAGAVGSRPAALVIAGTGSVGYAENAGGQSFRVGGFGFLFGDDGSCFAIARAALAAAMRASDRRLTTGLASAALAFFDVRDLRAFARAVSVREITRPQVAAFSRVVFDAARLGDAEARAIVAGAAAALGALGALAVQRVDPTASKPVPLALVGGAFDNSGFRAAVEREIATAAPSARVVTPHAEPAVGAALLAFDAAGRERPPAANVPA